MQSRTRSSSQDNHQSNKNNNNNNTSSPTKTTSSSNMHSPTGATTTSSLSGIGSGASYPSSGMSHPTPGAANTDSSWKPWRPSWRDRFPFSIFTRPSNPMQTGLCVTVSFWLFCFWFLAYVISKIMSGGTSAEERQLSAAGGFLPKSCSRFGRRYGVMFDAGSTGSRVHVYDFTYELDGRVLLHHELFEQVKPGLSSFKGEPKRAAESIDSLLQKAVHAVPEQFRACTPVELKATAGLRLLGKEASEELLHAIEHLFKTSPFFVAPRDSVIVMDGKDEGPLAWITVNFLLETIFSNSKQRPAAVLDMGGASTQIVFVPGADDEGHIPQLPSESKWAVTLFGKKHEMYQHSHLGYGLKEAGKRIAVLATDREGFECFPPGYEFTGKNGIQVSNTKNAMQSFTLCQQYVRKFINKKARCPFASSSSSHSSHGDHPVAAVTSRRRKAGGGGERVCSFNGVFQPHLSDYFKNGDFYIFSYFYDRMDPFLPDDGVMTVGDFKKFGRKICESSHKDKDSGAELSKEDQIAAKRNLGTECMDFVYLYELLSTGYDLEDAQTVNIRKKIKGVETAWTLGAMIMAMS